jgi:muramoyltetrapeptide carboxypeptidase
MKKIVPPKLKRGDTIRVIAPSSSLAIVRQEQRQVANARFEEMSLRLTFGRHVEEVDDFSSSSVASRVEDLHDAFLDPDVHGIMTVLGGYNCNQMLRYIDWEIVQHNPKVFCGYSDITALNNAILTKTGLVTYSGPHYTTFGQKLYAEYTFDGFRQCLFSDTRYGIEPSLQWSDDRWYIDQGDRHLLPNEGYWVINEGAAEGTIVGGNLCTFNLLQGTEYMPDLEDTLLFLEDDSESSLHTFDRDLQSLIHLPNFGGVRGLVIGRFQNASGVSKDLLTQIIKSKRELEKMPVIGNIDFGHTDPKITVPIGGYATVHAGADALLVIAEH